MKVIRDYEETWKENQDEKFLDFSLEEKFEALEKKIYSSEYRDAAIIAIWISSDLAEYISAHNKTQIELLSIYLKNIL
ncbi:MAG: hypothetical protein J7L39_01075, partial [Candidatus Aenigmarchaeota archaeon]|nr:hypothetical protein [Candidatus Aenigmarchaeota archaeon]